MKAAQLSVSRFQTQNRGVRYQATLPLKFMPEKRLEIRSP